MKIAVPPPQTPHWIASSSQLNRKPMAETVSPTRLLSGFSALGFSLLGSSVLMLGTSAVTLGSEPLPLALIEDLSSEQNDAWDVSVSVLTTELTLDDLDIQLCDNNTSRFTPANLSNTLMYHNCVGSQDDG